MDVEIAFFPVGDASAAGDAILVRVRRDDGLHNIYVVDGGTQDSGRAIVEELRTIYQIDRVNVAAVVSTHPDRDHSSGLRVVMEEANVQALWMHRPWLYAEELKPFFQNKNWTTEGLTRQIKQGVPVAVELEELAQARGIPIYIPFAGATVGPFRILSPAERFYKLLVPQFDNLPPADENALKAVGAWIGRRPIPPQRVGLLAAFAAGLASAAESWGVETLRDGGITSATNESSVVLYGQFGDRRCLLTGDAGRNALARTVFTAGQFGIDLSSLNMIQIPHHGSRSNVSPQILDAIVGPRRLLVGEVTKSAICSVPIDDERHPRKIVLNAFRRRGANWALTQGKHIYWWNGDWGRSLENVPARDLYSVVEQYD